MSQRLKRYLNDVLDGKNMNILEVSQDFRLQNLFTIDGEKFEYHRTIIRKLYEEYCIRITERSDKEELLSNITIVLK